tara:strand:- start:3835 stop:4029 length:195 start_codon:yes stop_codon:yes gene_type:complete
MKILINIIFISLGYIAFNLNYAWAENKESEDEINVSLMESQELEEMETIDDLSIDKEFKFPRDI